MSTNLRSLSAFEMNRKIPKDDIVCRMIEVYNAPWLAWQHLSIANKVGLKYLPRLEDKGLAQYALLLQKEVEDMVRTQSQRENVVAAAQDQATEHPLWKISGEDLTGLIRALMVMCL